MPKKIYSFEFWAVPKHIAQNKKLNSVDKMILGSIITRHNGESRLKVKIETLASDWGISISSVKHSIKKLEKMGFVDTLRLGKKLCNQYEIHPYN